MNQNFFLYLFFTALLGLIVGFVGEGNETSPEQRLCKVIKWISIIILGLYGLVIVAALTDGIGVIPYLGGAYWVRGHWRRR